MQNNCNYCKNRNCLRTILLHDTPKIMRSVTAENSNETNPKHLRQPFLYSVMNLSVLYNKRPPAAGASRIWEKLFVLQKNKERERRTKRDKDETPAQTSLKNKDNSWKNESQSQAKGRISFSVTGQVNNFSINFCLEIDE